MRRPFVRTGLAVLVLGGLGSYVYFVESKREETPEKPKQKVFTLDKAKVKELALEPRGGERIQLVKQGEAWKMTAPMAVPADTGAADAIVSSLEALEIDEVVSETPGKLADFGLESPRVAVGVLLQGASEPLKLLIGDKAPDGSGLYAKLPAQPRVFMIGSWLDSTFDKKPFDLRDRDLLKIKREDVATLEIEGPEGSYLLARDAKGEEWSFTKPVATRAGRWAVDGLLGTLEGLRMESVAAEQPKDRDLKALGLVKPAHTVVLVLKDGSQKRLEIGSAAGDKKYNAREASLAFVAVIPGALVDDLAKGMKELRAKRLLDVATYDVAGFDALFPGGKRSFVRTTVKNDAGVETPQWKRTTPEPKDLDTGKVQDALFKIGGLEAQEFVDAPGPAATYGLDKPELRLEIRYEKDRPPEWLEVARKDGAGYARRIGDAALLQLDPAKLEELVKAFSEL